MNLKFCWERRANVSNVEKLLQQILENQIVMQNQINSMQNQINAGQEQTNSIQEQMSRNHKEVIARLTNLEENQKAFIKKTT